MSDLTTIFVKGGEYIDKAAYIQQRDEAERLREKCMNKDAEIERLRNELDDVINKAYEEFAKYEADIEWLRAALKPFADAHKSQHPYGLITLHDLRVAHNALSTECEHEWGVRQGGSREHCRKCGVFRVEVSRVDST